MASVRQEFVTEFMQICGSTEQEARKYLESHNYSLTRAVDKYLCDAPSPTSSVVNETKRSKIATNADMDDFFVQYTSAGDRSTIGPDGIQRLSDCLDVDPLDVVWLYIAEKCNAKKMGYFSKEEWSKGMRSLCCVSSHELKLKIPNIRSSISQDPNCYKSLYTFSFTYTLQEGSRIISFSDAVALWEILLPLSGWNLAEEWLRFVRNREDAGVCKSVTKDHWNMLHALSRRFPDSASLSQFSDSSDAWPMIIDDFVDQVNPTKLE
jgi:hypothetical protein